MSTTANPKITGNKQDENSRKPKATHPSKQVEGSSSSSEEEDGELCFICTEPMETFAVGQCDHRTCHKCNLRLRALYDIRNCAYCKTEQKVVVFTKDAQKPFENFSAEDTPFSDKKLSIRFETQEMYKEALHMLEYNCPQTACTDTFKNWAELKQHVRKSHNLNICDLCCRHKKIFPYEHTLYTLAQLTKHHKEGDKDFNTDDETGFSGHPECGFCKTRFFGDDELFVHCRDQHEQCFLCVRNGNRHEYYANYSGLEEHFKANHCMCLYPQCLEKKFVVFDSPIDLKAHQVQEHGESTAGLQRSMQAQNRQLELNFQYESSSRPHHRDNVSNRKGKEKEKNQKQAPTTTSTTAQDFPSMTRAQEPVVSEKTQPRIIPGASTKKGKEKEKRGLQKPTGFGALSTASAAAANDSGEGSGDAGGGGSHSSIPLSTQDSHAAFLRRVGDMLQSKAKVAEFRSLTSAFRKSSLSGQEYVNQIVQLTNNNVEQSGKIFKGVADLLDIEDKKWELIRTWRNKQTAMSHFPALDVRERSPAVQPSRVLVIKPKPTKNSVGGGGGGGGGGAKPKNVWDKVASAANVANNKASRPSSVRSSPQTSRPSSPVNTYRQPNNKTPWSGGASCTPSASTPPASQAFPSLKPKTFPALPMATPKHQMILNMRRQTSGQNLANAWSGENVFDPAAKKPPAANNNNNSNHHNDNNDSSNGKKKKGRKNNVLFRVGL